MAVAGTSDQLSEIKSTIQSYLELKDLGQLRSYLNITIEDSESVFYLSQTEYIDKTLQEFNMSDAFPVTTPMLDDDKKRWDKKTSPPLDDAQQKRYQAAVGCILYIMHATRPNIAYTIIRLSQYSSNPRTIHWEGIKRLLQYLKATRLHALTLGNVEALHKDHTSPIRKINLIGYFDAAHADTTSRRSTCGYIFLMQGSPISWVSKV